jgi:hypothetical protein
MGVRARRANSFPLRLSTDSRAVRFLRHGYVATGIF